MLTNGLLIFGIMVALVIGVLLEYRMENQKISRNNNSISEFNLYVMANTEYLEERYNEFELSTQLNEYNYYQGITDNLVTLDLVQEYQIIQDMRINILEAIHAKVADSITNRMLYRISNLQFKYDSLMRRNHLFEEVAKMNRGADLS